MRRKYVLFISLLMPLALVAQVFNGRVTDTDGEKLPAVNIYTPDQAFVSQTDADGEFFIGKSELPEGADRLVFSYIGFKADTLLISELERGFRAIQLEADLLQETTVTGRSGGRSLLENANVETISIAKLKSAACCNLSESFQSTASIDVVFSDAVSGAKEIRMLGLDGYYVQMLNENLPSIRGLNNRFGLTLVPGPWIEQISINKGIGSVVNGYESLTGQINTSIKRPQSSPGLFVNGFASHVGSYEFNADHAHDIGDHWSVSNLYHGHIFRFEFDDNNDGFMGQPMVSMFTAMNRWKFLGPKRFESEYNLTYAREDRAAGQLSSFQNPYRVSAKTDYVNFTAKTGFIMKGEQSLGILYEFYRNKQDINFAGREYDGLEHFGYINVIFQKEVAQGDQLRMGLSGMMNDFRERLDLLALNRREIVPGAFIEYSFLQEEKLAIIPGFRVDYHNLYGWLWSPRLNVKWQIRGDMVLRLNGGKGYRKANVFAENSSIFFSSRQLSIAGGLGMDQAWNYGINFTKEFFIGFRPGMLSVDFYRTDFVEQQLTDLEDVDQVRIYMLDGRSFANSFQVDATYELIRNTEFALSYRYNHVFTDYSDQFLEKPLNFRHRGLFSIDYNLRGEWMFHTALQIFGTTRLPSTQANPEVHRLPAFSPAFATLNAQLTKKFGRWEVYLGGENLTGFRLSDPIIAADQPFGPFFDASLVYGPANGPRIYAGFRLTLERKQRKIHLPNLENEHKHDHD